MAGLRLGGLTHSKVLIPFSYANLICLILSSSPSTQSCHSGVPYAAGQCPISGLPPPFLGQRILARRTHATPVQSARRRVARAPQRTLNLQDQSRHLKTALPEPHCTHQSPTPHRAAHTWLLCPPPDLSSSVVQSGPTIRHRDLVGFRHPVCTRWGIAAVCGAVKLQSDRETHTTGHAISPWTWTGHAAQRRPTRPPPHLHLTAIGDGRWRDGSWLWHVALAGAAYGTYVLMAGKVGPRHGTHHVQITDCIHCPSQTVRCTEGLTVRPVIHSFATLLACHCNRLTNCLCTRFLRAPRSSVISFSTHFDASHGSIPLMARYQHEPSGFMVDPDFIFQQTLRHLHTNHKSPCNT